MHRASTNRGSPQITTAKGERALEYAYRMEYSIIFVCRKNIIDRLCKAMKRSAVWKGSAHWYRR